jgi:hypothetical protein
MESPEGFANAVLWARLTSAKIDLNREENRCAALRDEMREEQEECWYWHVSAKAALDLLEELARRHPDDILFRPTGGRRANRVMELGYHLAFELAFEQRAKKIPREVQRGAGWRGFLRKLKF